VKVKVKVNFTLEQAINAQRGNRGINILRHGEGKGKGKLHPRTGLKGPEREQRYKYTLSLTSTVDVGGWSTL